MGELTSTHHPTSLNHPRDPLKQRNIAKRVARNRDHVGKTPRRNRAYVGLSHHHFGGHHGGALDRLHRDHAVADQVGELAGIGAVGEDPGVRPLHHPHPGSDRTSKTIALGVGLLSVHTQQIA